jgi:predicted Zn-dependent protease
VVEFQAAADLEPENPAHWHGLAKAQRRAGNLPEALAAIQRLLKLNPNDRAALSLGYEMLLAAGNLEEANRRALQLLKLAPLDLLTMRRLIDCRCRLKLTPGAEGLETIRLLRRTQRMSPNKFLGLCACDDCVPA